VRVIVSGNTSTSPIKKSPYVHQAAAAEGTTSDRPQRAVKTSDRHTKTGERKRGEKSQQEQPRETRDGTTADQRKTVQNSAEAKKMYLAIMSKQAEVLLSRFVQVLIRLSTPLFSRGIQSTPTIRGSTRPASRDNSSEKPRSRSVNAQLSSLPLRQRHQGQGESTWQ
jgi:hypothetical protein